MRRKSRFDRPPFDPKGRYVAGKDITFNGKRYDRGDSFPWQLMECTEAKARTLYNQRHIVRAELAGSSRPDQPGASGGGVTSPAVPKRKPGRPKKIRENEGAPTGPGEP